MKKNLFIALFMLAVLPFGAHALTPIQQLPGSGTPFLPVENTEGGAAPIQQYSSSVSQLTAQGDMYGCEGQGGQGGSLSNALNSGIDDLIGQGKNIIRSKAGEILGKLGPASGIAQKLLDKGLNIVSGELSNGAKSLLSSIGIDGALSDAASALGLGSGALGEALGAAGLGGGLTAVPTAIVSDLNTQTFKNTEQTNAAIDAQTRALYIKECFSDKAIKKAAAAVIAQGTRASIDYLNGTSDGYTKYFQGWEPGAVRDAQFEQIVDEQLSGLCSPTRAETQQTILTSYQRSTDLGSQVQCNVDEGALGSFIQGEPSQNALDNLFYMAFNTEGLAQPLVAQQITDKQIAAKQYEIERTRFLSGDFKNEVDCPVEKVGGLCPTLNPHVTVPAILNSELAKNKIIVEPSQQQLAADEIGEMINDLMATLTQQAFQGLGGLLGLSKKSKTQGGSGSSFLDQVAGDGGSFTDQIGDTSSSDALATGKDAMLNDMEGTLGIADDYLDILYAITDNLENTKAAYRDVSACYVTLTTSISNKISTDTAQKRAEEASTTIKNLLDPEIKRIGNVIIDTKDAIAQLETIMAEVRSAQTTEDLAAASAQYQSMKQEGLVYTTTDITALTNELTAGALALKVLNVDATDKLKECRSL